MRIKVYTAPHLHEALAKVRQDMGPEALILDRQQVKDANGGMWHVHAALDNHSASPEKSDERATTQLAKPVLNTKNEPAPEATSDATIDRLERLVVGLSNKESASLRNALASGREQESFDHLMRLGVAATYAFDMAGDYAVRKPMGSKTLQWSRRINPDNGRNTILFSGPSGSGKTTLIAKLAAHYSLKGIRVAVISTDTERMGGLDALKAYCSTLGIPFYPLKKTAEAKKIHSDTHSAQLLLIDTEGWSPRRDTCLKRQTGLWDAMDCTRKIMVIPANMDEEDAMQQLSHHTASDMTDIAFSKLDETQKPGKIVNWSISAKLPMSYCSFGPEVPEQMGWLTAQTLTTLLSKHSGAATA
ncbi:flagellar biosynthesis protein FlhF [Mariprofundus micogutta]|uniref:Flagellar biosynthesis protein FlhF n=1 Tax=Mariprofundus micogutta TaxID=1921010 RepID=A0A1L8CKJ6_9PROT|nr:GTP-binding protein [Mariprofundus micogutta]GAV19421.1 flagellar biosynthesis protein FlhF [Mariprofundus micogutta]